jgi:uncharacterized protein (TIGR02145 family)
MYKNYKYIFQYLLIATLLLLNSCEKEKSSGLPVDGDGNEYDTVVIGTQTWLQENLKTTSYRNGDPIYLITDNDKWTTWQIGAYCWYDNNPKYKDIYGGLYNWYAAKTQALCPIGWHVPTNEEWTILIDYLGGILGKAGDKLKEAGIQHWGIDNRGTNESDFTALPGGHRSFSDGSFEMIRQVAEFWASDLPYFMGLGLHSQAATIAIYPETGLSIRCIKDK